MPKNPASTTKTCRKCGGSGYLPHFARTDAGRCWSCQGLADTSYTREIEASRLTDEEAAARWAALCEERKVARQARRAVACCCSCRPCRHGDHDQCIAWAPAHLVDETPGA